MSNPIPRRTLLQQAGGVTAAAAIAGAAPQVAARNAQSNGAIRLVTRGDDMGCAQAVNEASIRVCKEGIVRSLEVMAPTPWFLDAVRLLEQHPSIDVGVHLTLTSEWDRLKWRPLTHAPSLVDADGNFFPKTSERPGSPPHTGLLQSGFKLDEVEQELRAQIVMVKRHLPGRVTHVSYHMGAAEATPELKALTLRLAKELQLGADYPNLKSAHSWNGPLFTVAEKEHGLIRTLEALTPGDWMTLEHPGLDTPEMRNIFHKGYETVAADRAGVTHAFTSPRVKEVIKQRGIQLISYAEL